MTSHDDLDRRLSSHYATEAPQRAPDWLLASALETIDRTPQRRVLVRLPWRTPLSATTARLAVAAVLVIAVGGITLSVLGPVGPFGSGGQPPPSPSPSPTPSPSPSPTPFPALTERFTSNIHGISASYPPGWVLKFATEPWTAGIPFQDDPFVDTIEVTSSGNPFFGIASQPLDGTSGAQWFTDTFAGPGCETTQSIVIDGEQGAMSIDCAESRVALVTSGDRGYYFFLYGSEDVDFFEAFLATVTLDPQDAIDPNPSPSP